MTIGKSAFCLTLYLTGVHFRGELQHFGHVGEQKIKCRPIRAQEIAAVRLQEELHDRGILFECSRSPRSAFGFHILSDRVIVMLHNILILSSLGGRYQSAYIYTQMCPWYNMRRWGRNVM